MSAARYPSNRPVLLDEDGLPIPCRACESNLMGVPQLATHIMGDEAVCDSCDVRTADSPPGETVYRDTDPCPPPEPEQDDEDMGGTELALEASLALLADARVAKVPPAAALRIGRDAIARMAGRR